MAEDGVLNTPLPSEGGSRRVAFATHQKNYAGRSMDSSSVRSSNKTPTPTYGRRASLFIFEHLSDMKDAGLGIGEKFNLWIYGKISFLSKKWFTHCFLIIVMILYTVGGALLFLTVEGQNETTLIERDMKLQVKHLLEEIRRKSLTAPEEFSEKEWIAEAARAIIKFEINITEAYHRHPLVVSHTSGRVWTIWNSVVYCATLYTTIGYGHLYPTTFTGRVLTMAYSTIGIPLFLIALTDFGKLFTRGIKFVWSYFRTFYYTRSCRRVRRKSRVGHLFKGAQVMYDYATFRRGSLWGDPPQDAENPSTPSPQSVYISEPQTPALSSFEIDDEFNLPISLALIILVAYMLIGAAAFMVWEHWEFFPAFYFVFISMSTVGFGDIVPEKPIYMIVSIVYLCFGLALMSMCFNVVQDKLSDTFTNASERFTKTFGADDDAGEKTESIDENAEDSKSDGEKENKEDKQENKEILVNGDIEGYRVQIEESPFDFSSAKYVR